MGTWLLLLGALTTHASAQRSLSGELTAAEESRLNRGRLVVRETTERRGDLRLFGGSSWQVVNLPADAVWRALCDRASRLRHMLPQTNRSREIGREGNTRTIRLTHRYGFVRASYAVDFTYDHSTKTVVFRLSDEEPKDLRAGWGYIRLRRWGPKQDKTLISFGMLVDVGSGLISGALRPTLHEWMLKVPFTIKQYVEGRGRRHYT